MQPESSNLHNRLDFYWSPVSFHKKMEWNKLFWYIEMDNSKAGFSYFRFFETKSHMVHLTTRQLLLRNLLKNN